MEWSSQAASTAAKKKGKKCKVYHPLLPTKTPLTIHDSWSKRELKVSSRRGDGSHCDYVVVSLINMDKYKGSWSAKTCRVGYSRQR